MKRTAEFTLTIIGTVFYVFSLLFGILRLWMEGNKGHLFDFISQNQEDMALSSQDMSLLEQTFNTNLASGGALLIVMPILAIILAIVAMTFLKGNKKPVAAGIILIATGVLYPIITLGGGILSGILLLIAGILSLARKPKTIIEG